MKTKKILGLVTLAGSLFLFHACKEEVASSDDLPEIDKSAEIAGSCIITGTVNEDEAEGILFMADEEKMARDVYTFFSSKYSLPIFRNIAKSEGIHMKTVGNLITAFKLSYTGTDVPGEFVNEDIARLYKELAEKGSVSLDEALKTGALIEETDILDLEEVILNAGNASVKMVLSNLLLASENHLRAFTGILKARKVVYEPVLLDNEYFNAVQTRTTKVTDYSGKRAKN